MKRACMKQRVKYRKGKDKQYTSRTRALRLNVKTMDRDRRRLRALMHTSTEPQVTPNPRKSVDLNSSARLALPI